MAQQLADKLMASGNECMVCHKPLPFSKQVQQWFAQGERLILITATGIAVRTLAPVLTDKYHDPAVLVLDELGRFVIPLISGHEGGANAWGQSVAELINAQLVITTANTYVKPIYTIGLGCERDCPDEYINAIFLQALTLAKVEIEQIKLITSIDIKAAEKAFIRLAEQYRKPFVTYDADALNTVKSLLKTPSEYVFNTVGVYGVAESAALYSAQSLAGTVPELVLAKIKNTKATAAIARAYLDNHKRMEEND